MPLITQKRFINEALEAHNKYRAKHGVQPLEHDPALSQKAQEWAEETLAVNNVIKYQNFEYKNKPVGENILRWNSEGSTKTYYSGEEATDEWMKEESNYSYDGEFSPLTGHFTQIVWKNTTTVGFAFAQTEDGFTYVVANYYPAGNYRGTFNENVFPPKGKSPPVLLQQTRSSPPVTDKETRASPPVSDKQTRASPPVAEKEKRASPPVSSKQAQDRFISEALECHNLCREKHGVAPLTHNPELSEIAQNYANKLASSKEMVHSHSKFNNESMGENLAFFFATNADHYPGDKASMQWYDEIKDHNFDKDHQSATGHFTQLVWKSTKTVGFGVACADDGSFYAVANYFPAGNMISKYRQNVFRPYDE